jgi:hypothetical protein
MIGSWQPLLCHSSLLGGNYMAWQGAAWQGYLHGMAGVAVHGGHH